MGFDVTEPSTSSDQLDPTFEIIEFFKARPSVVVAAFAALDAMPAELTRLRAAIDVPDPAGARHVVETLDTIVRSATIDADNLLVADPMSAREPFIMCAISRQPSGVVGVRTIELDRDSLALTGVARGTTPRALDALAVAIDSLEAHAGVDAIATVTAALDVFAAQVRSSLSRLSIIKARLDLQRSFLSSVMDADAVAVPHLRLDSHLDQARARDMALEARRLLSLGTRHIASGNRKTLAALFSDFAAEAVGKPG